jgi:biopolymer transport protein TolR
VKRRNQKGGLQAEMNLTNLIDVVFCLLIVFMITAPLMSKGIKLNLPKVDAPSLQEHKAVTVSLDAQGNVYVEGKPTTQSKLGADFLAAWDQTSPVFFQADSTADYGRALAVITELRKSGAEQLGFLTRPIERELE